MGTARSPGSPQAPGGRCRPRNGARRAAPGPAPPGQPLRAQPPACPESRTAEGPGRGYEVPGSSPGPEGGATFPPRSPTAGLPLPSERFPQVGGPSPPSHGPVCPPGVPHQHGPPASCSHHFGGSERHEEPASPRSWPAAPGCHLPLICRSLWVVSGKVGVCLGHSGPVTPLPIPAAGAHRGYHLPAPHPCPEGPALCPNPQQGVTLLPSVLAPPAAARRPALSFAKFKSGAPSSSHTSWMPFNSASPWKVQFTCRRQALRSMPTLPVHDPSLL